MMHKKFDGWHYARDALAQQLMGLFESGLSSSLTLFAPRRMGKTEFLLKDVAPLATEMGWQVFYFSFLDTELNAESDLTQALHAFLQNLSTLKATKTFFSHIAKVGVSVVKVGANVEFKNVQAPALDVKTLIAELAAEGKTLLLLDEIQILAQYEINARFIASLRTALDINKDQVKVIFTGSSQEGLRRMFSEAKAPFFHFGQNLPFPELDRGFTDHLADCFTQITKTNLNRDALWDCFIKMRKVPEWIRALVERLVLNPNASLTPLCTQVLSDFTEARSFVETWNQCSALEQKLLLKIAHRESGFFREDIRTTLAKDLGASAPLPLHTIQSSLRSLERKTLIGRNFERGSYQIDDLEFLEWLNSPLH